MNKGLYGLIIVLTIIMGILLGYAGKLDRRSLDFIDHVFQTEAPETEAPETVDSDGTDAAQTTTLPAETEPEETVRPNQQNGTQTPAQSPTEPDAEEITPGPSDPSDDPAESDPPAPPASSDPAPTEEGEDWETEEF